MVKIFLNTCKCLDPHLCVDAKCGGSESEWVYHSKNNNPTLTTFYIKVIEYPIVKKNVDIELFVFFFFF